NLTDTLPADVTWQIDQNTGDPTDFTISNGALTLSQAFISGGDTLGRSGSLQGHIPGTPPPAHATLSNTATVSATNEPSTDQGNNSESASITVNAPDLTVSKKADDNHVNAGDPVGFTVTISNSGAGQANGVSLMDTLPSGVTWQI